MKHPLRILIDGLPRSGTTTFARVFSEHPQVRTVIEPFHPRRHHGVFHAAALASFQDSKAFAAVWSRWNVVKHVWEPETLWPFETRPSLHRALWSSATHLLAIERRNLLKRYVSAEISRALRFWIGSPEEFRSRLGEISLPPFDPQAAHRSIALAQQRLQQRRDFLEQARHLESLEIDFEDFFEARNPDQQLQAVNSLFTICGLAPVAEPLFTARISPWLDPAHSKWSSPEIYDRIPDIRKFEAQLGSDATGWLFR